HKIAAIKKEAEERSKKYEGVRLSITAHTNVATGSLYGSVTGAEIAAELAKLGLETERKHIFIKTIKEVGNYVATVRLHKEVAVEIPVEVLSDAPLAVEKKEEAPAAEAPAVEEAAAEA
ncbi:MAG: 50S ribosomal protein L9, partial [Porphyromonadaceae bacterium]|nr:50S ribosomal protein L9 [Porphyromonadaceae bacterium]